MSIMEDVVESMRDLFLDEGLEDRVLDHLKQLWQSKLQQSRALDDLRSSSVESSRFLLQLPAGFGRSERECSAPIVNPTGQNVQRLPVKKGPETLATFSLPAGLTYPVQIPAGVTLQTASGQLYKVNVPVVVTQGPAGNPPFSQAPQKVIKWLETAAPPRPAPPTTAAPPPPEPSTLIDPPAVETSAPRCPPACPPACPPPQELRPEFLPDGEGPEPDPAALLDLQVQSHMSCDVEDILKEAIEEERNKALTSNMAAPLAGTLTEEFIEPKFDAYGDLSDIVQLDGAAGDSDLEPGDEDLEPGDEDPLEENDFLGLINGEALKALQDADGSSDGDSVTSSSDGVDELADAEDEDPLNSGDDVVEQDIPDLFDTDNVIVCQYDKIHRSKNRWKFHLKDGVMCYGGRDYVFSKAIGEAEW